MQEEDLGRRKEELRTAWTEFVKWEFINRDLVRPVIARSWQRSRAWGVDPYLVRAQVSLEGRELERELSRQEALVSVARPVMENLYDLVKGSGFAVTLANREGVLLLVLGDGDVVQEASRGNLLPGADWSEQRAGTNAIGTVLEEGYPLQIFAAEHYCVASHQWTCSAAPVRDPQGKIIAALNMTGAYEKVHPHTLGMVVAAAGAIENHLRMQQALERLSLIDQYKTAIMESIGEGLLAVDTEGRVTHLNQPACRLLRLPAQDTLGRPLQELLGKQHPLVRMLRRQRNISDEEVYEGKAGAPSYTVTTRLVESGGSVAGVLAVLRPMEKVKSLVHRMVGAEAKFSFADLVGKNPAFLQSLQYARAAAESTSNVLLLGESGTGKEMVAQAIHNASARRHGPFIALNCAALPRELVGSELFGYTEGAFTGARRGGSPGKFELADGGTLFLDEIGEMPLETQAVLLRALQDREVMRIGGNRVIPVDVRVIAASNKDLWQEVGRGQFRSDLFFRLNVLAIQMVPLRERKDDLPLLVDHLVHKLSTRLGKRVDGLAPQAMAVLSRYHWPGNVRELENALERALNVAAGRQIQPEDLPAYLRAEPAGAAGGMPSLEEYERQLISRLVAEHHGNLSRVARELGISRTTLYRKLSIYDITPARQ